MTLKVVARGGSSASGKIEEGKEENNNFKKSVAQIDSHKEANLLHKDALFCAASHGCSYKKNRCRILAGSVSRVSSCRSQHSMVVSPFPPTYSFPYYPLLSVVDCLLPTSCRLLRVACCTLLFYGCIVVWNVCVLDCSGPCTFF